MSSKNRKLKYGNSINEAIRQMMTTDDSVFLMGQGVKSPWYVGSTCTGLLNEFGEDRVIDTPVSENAITGCAIGAAIAGMRSIVVHPRMDFMLYAFDPIVNEAANWYYMNGGKKSVPTVIWGIINRGGEQGAQHSQSLHAMFSHIPGLKVVMPSTPYDAKGLMIAAIKDDNPVVFIDDRWLYDIEGEVPEEIYEIPIGKGNIIKEGKDVTIVANSFMVKESIDTHDILLEKGICAEIIDLRSIKPYDGDLILDSVKKTGRLIVIDGGWLTYGASAEISAFVSDEGFNYLKSPVKRIALPDCPAPANRILEQEYYSIKNKIISTVVQLVKV